MEGSASRNRHIDVDPWTNAIGSLLDRCPKLLLKAGDLETWALRHRLEGIAVTAPIHICGLARSGSTILLELLAGHRDTVTHRYRDFPLLPIPYMWNWFVDRAGRIDPTPRERSHHDRISITAESPEAFEEVLWMAFFPRLHDPAEDAVLAGATSSPRFEAFYRDHIRKLLLLRGGARYLAKGNYNVTRIGYLRRIFPDARFIVPVREPAWHIASLMKQHRLFLAAAEDNAQVAHYMRRSGHFEFGPGRQATNIGRAGAAPEAQACWDAGDEIGGWAHQWAAIYGHVADVAADPATGDAIRIVRYEDLCDDPASVVAGVLDHCGLSPDGIPERAAAAISRPDYYRPSFGGQELDRIHAIAGAAAERLGYRRPQAQQHSRRA